MLTYVFDKEIKKPLYIQLYECLKSDIVTGILQSGEKLPSKRSLAEHLGISKVTVETAYSMLLSEGYIYSESKRGYYVEADLSLHPLNKKSEVSNSFEYHKRYRIDLSSNTVPPEQFPFDTWAKIMRNICLDYREELLRPVPNGGAFCLREALSDYLFEHRGIVASPYQIIIGSGSGYLYGVITGLIGKDKVYGVENPSYRGIYKSYTSNGVLCVPVSVDEGGVSLADAVEKKPDVLHISPSHNFPTGVVTGPKRRREILSALYSGDERYIVEDDFDSELRFSGQPIPTLYASDNSGRVIYMNTFSKTIAPSVRISYLVLPESLAQKYYSVFPDEICPVPSFEQYALASFISDGYFERHLRRNKKYYKTLGGKLKDIYYASEVSKRSEIIESEAGLHFFIKLYCGIDDSVIKDKLAEKDINCSFYSDYLFAPEEKDLHKLLVNYSGLSQEDFSVFLTELNSVF